jgi:hypothetical protein
LTSLNGSSLFVMSRTIFATFFALLFTRFLISAKTNMSFYINNYVDQIVKKQGLLMTLLRERPN